MIFVHNSLEMSESFLVENNGDLDEGSINDQLSDDLSHNGELRKRFSLAYDNLEAHKKNFEDHESFSDANLKNSDLCRIYRELTVIHTKLVVIYSSM